MNERTILVVEDEPAHARILEKSLRRLGLIQPIVTLPNAAKALAYLQASGEYADQARPERLLLILDLNLPGINGFDFLTTLDTLSELREIPRILVSTSDEPADLARSRDFVHLAYLVKPLDYARIAEIIRAVDAPKLP
jgi:CheY-like chemotaxis protein